MQYHVVPCNTVQYSEIPCNTMQYHTIPCNTMQYHASLITADGAYHCPVGSIMAIFILIVIPSPSKSRILILMRTNFIAPCQEEFLTQNWRGSSLLRPFVQAGLLCGLIVTCFVIIVSHWYHDNSCLSMLTISCLFNQAEGSPFLKLGLSEWAKRRWCK